MVKPANGAIALLSALSIFSVVAPPLPSYAGILSGSYEVINPKDAVLNTELSSSEDVKEGLSKINSYKQVLVDLKKDLVSLKSSLSFKLVYHNLLFWFIGE